MEVRIAGINPESIVDGDGVRYVIFTQGCKHNCLGCQNPDTHDFNGGYILNTDDVLSEILDDPILDGITLSGGDPFFQADKLIGLCKEVKKNGLTVWAYTGFLFDRFLAFNENKSDSEINQSMIELLKYVDVVVDGPFMLDKRTLDTKFRGSSNQRIVDVKRSFESGHVVSVED